MIRHRRATRLAAGLLAGALALAAAPLAGTAGADNHIPPPATPLGEGNFCDGAPDDNPFTDLDQEVGDTREVILCLVATELTQGTTPTTYSPGEPVNRRQMALFIKRLADLLVENQAEGADLPALPAYDGESDFDDVAEDDPGAEAIGQLEQAGIISGFPDGTFRPNADVSRRQMAKFIVELFAYLDERPVASDDYFDDDDGDSGEANLNRLAEVGIFQGDGEGNVFPGEDIARRQMANVVMRTAQVFLTRELVESPVTDAGDGAGATLSLTPTDLEVIEYIDGIDSTTTDDDRTYTATGLPEGEYHLALVRSDRIAENNGRYTFAEEGATGLVDNGVLAARIVEVNGTPVDPQQFVGGITAQGGTVTFTVDGDGSEALVAVIAEDGGSNTRLEIDDEGRPTEAFGVGGEIQYIAAEADSGAPVNGEVVLAGADFAVVEALLGGAQSTVYFRAGDTYRIGSLGSFEEATPAEFLGAVSRGDTLSTCGADIGTPDDYTQDAANGYCLEDAAPANPTALTASQATPGDPVIDLAWTAASPAGSYNVYRNAQSCANTTVDELTLVANVPAWETSYRVTGLTDETAYCFLVTTVESGDESELAVGSADHGDDNTAELSTTAVPEAPTITSAELTTDVTTGELTEGDVATLVLSEAMDPDTLEDATFTVMDGDDDTTDLLCTGTPLLPLPIPAADDGQTEAECELDEDATTLTITMIEDGDDDNAGGGNDGLQYDLVITAAAGLADADDGLTIDVENSTDTLIS